MNDKSPIALDEFGCNTIFSWTLWREAGFDSISRHLMPLQHLANRFPISYFPLLHRDIAFLSRPHPPSLTHSIPSSHLWRRTKTETHSDARNPLRPRDCNNLFPSLRSSIPNASTQKQIYGNPPIAYIRCCCQIHMRAAKHAFSLAFCIGEYGSTTALCSVIITSSTLSFTHFSSPI